MLTKPKPPLETAVSGICRILQLEDVTIYEFHQPEGSWSIRNTTAAFLSSAHPVPPETSDLLNAAMADDGQALHHNERSGEPPTVLAILRLQMGPRVLGALVANSLRLTSHLYTPEAFIILLQAFAQNLAALWRNCGVIIMSPGGWPAHPARFAFSGSRL